MFNLLFLLACVAGFIGRALNGRAISIAAGLTLGVILSEAWKFGVYLLPRVWHR